MLSSIHPLGERSRNGRWTVTATAYGVGSVAGGAVVGTALGAAGRGVFARVPEEAVVLAAAAVCVVAAVCDASGVRTPGLRRQVDERWLHRYRGWVYGLGFGFQLGLGVVTIVTTAGVYAAFALAFLSATAVRGALVGAVFGFARAAVIVRNARVRDPVTLRAAHRRLDASAGTARAVAIWVPIGVALFLSAGVVA